ncbi:MAG TPA: universal stress protein [Deltaproteobacteria bacterium]|nr:universal stress protein [Deltaproteobacteria bacterium]
MFSRVLVPVDFSEKCRRSLDIAVNIASRYEGSIDLLHVIETLVDTEYSELESFYRKLEREALKDMDDLVAPYRDGTVDIHTDILFGSRSLEILNYAQQRNAGLIIMNSHAVDINQSAQGWGTISYKVALLSQCPVMLVK